MSTSPRRSKKSSSRGRRERHLRVRSELRTNPDIAKIGNAVIALALAQAEKEAEEQRARTAAADQTSPAQHAHAPERASE